MRLRALTVIMFCFLVTGSFVIIFIDETCEASENEIYVNDDWYPFRDGTAEHPYSSIQYAIDVADEGDTIYVFGGEYNETLVLNKRITLIGSIDEGNSIICKKARHKYTVEITADFVTLESFNISDITNYNRVAVVFVRSNNVVVQGNNITQSNTWGVYLDSSSKDNTLGNNYINDTKGVYLYSSPNNVITGNNISNCDEPAIYMSSSNNNIIYNNNFFYSERGIHALDCSNSNISNNTIRNNVLDGIKLSGGSNNILGYNVISDNGGNGVDLSSSNTFVRGNIFDNNQMGINLGQSNCNISSNYIYNSYIYGIYAGYGTKGNLICLNHFINNYQNAQEIGNNKWYYGSRGNYWDDYNEVDRDLDGIGDTPYTVAGGGVDMYPLGYFLKPPAKPMYPVPEEEEYGVGLKVTLEVQVSDPDSGEVNVFFYNEDDTLYGVDYNVKIEEKGSKKVGTASCSFTLNFSRTFFWYAIVNDSKLENRSDYWFFVTKQRPPENEKPVADPGGPYTALVDQVIVFNASGSYDPDGDIDFYRWNFGDGTSEILDISPTHSYSSPDIYYIILTVIDNDGTSAVANTTAKITTVPTNQEPSADAGGPYTGTIDKLITFNGSKSSDQDGTVVNYTWDFGDGNKGYGMLITHSYSQAGTYTVELTVTDDEGGTDTTSTSITITASSSGVPGFELIFIVLAATIVLLWKKNKKQ